MKKHLICFLFLGMATSASFAQKKTLTLEESMTNLSFGMTIRQLHGFRDGGYGQVVSGGKNGDALIKTTDGKTDTLLWASAFQQGKKSFPKLNWKSGTYIYSLAGSDLITYNLATKQAATICKISEKAENEEVEENTLAVAYTEGNNLFVQKSGQKITVTQEANKDVVCGQTVHRSEYGINKGTFWSPKGSYLAFYRMDQSMVTDYPIVEIGEKPAKVRNIKYPMAGQTSHEVSLGVYSFATGKVTYLEVTGPKDQYLTGITWTPDEKYITITLLNRETNHLKLNVYDAAYGKFVKTLLEEKSTQYLDPKEGPLFVNPALDFVWQSERNGCNRLYFYDWEGKVNPFPDQHHHFDACRCRAIDAQ